MTVRTPLHGRALISATVIMVAALASGCATKPATAEEEVAVWLSESPRMLEVRAAPEMPTPRVRVRDHKVGERVLNGTRYAAEGAVRTVAGMCQGGAIGCVVGVALAPVGAAIGGVAGAASVKSVDVYHSIGEAKGAPELFATAVNAKEVGDMLTHAVLSLNDGGRHVLRAPGDVERASDGKLTLSVIALDLAGATGEDANVALAIEVHAELASPEVTAWTWGRFLYESSSHAVSEWRAGEGAMFRAELAKAADAIAALTLKELHKSPGMGAELRTAEARRIRARR